MLSYEELRGNPEKLQCRIEKFLGKTFIGSLDHVNHKNSSMKVTHVPRKSRQLLDPMFRETNIALYNLLDNHPGRPWMEQHPFPHFVTGDVSNQTK